MIFVILSLDTLRLEEERVVAQYYNFLHELDMNSVIYTRIHDPIAPLENAGAYLISVGGVGPSVDGLSVRGGGYMENAIYINGIPLTGMPYRFLTFLPVDRDAIRVIRFYRGDMPARYDGVLSSVVEVETDEDYDYAKAGIPMVSLQWSGLYGDYFFPGLFFPDARGWRSATALLKRGGFSVLATGMERRTTSILNYFYDESGTDTIYFWEDRAITTGFSFRKGNLWIYSSLEVRNHRDSTTLEGLSQGRAYNWISGVWFSKGNFGMHFQNHVYNTGPLDSLNALVFRNSIQLLSVYYDFGNLSLGLNIPSTFRPYPLVRFAKKVFLDSTQAVRIFAGTTLQPFFTWGFPLYVRVIPAHKVNYGYSLIAGYERIERNYTLELNGFVRYFHPYFVPNPLLFASNLPNTITIPLGMVFLDRSTITFGFDLYVSGFKDRNLSFSLTVLRSLFTDTWSPAPEDIVFVFNMDYRFLNVRWIYGMVRSELVFNSDRVERYVYRESSMYIYSIMFPFKWKDLHFRIGVYNVIPRPDPPDEFSAIYRAYPIPILSVKKEF